MRRRTKKERILSIPLLGYSLRVLVDVAKGPKVKDATFRELRLLSEQFNENQQSVKELSTDLTKSINEINESIAALRHLQDNLADQLAKKSFSKAKETNTSKSDLFADDHSLDVFYANFEDRFRGTEELISKRQEEYLPYFSKAKINFEEHPVLDIGSGRGEFLKLLNANKINAVGLDINEDMVRRTVEKGLKAELGDALSYLKRQKAQSLGVITGFHIVEHIPFSILMQLFTAAYRTLCEDGFVIFETPNPENVTVGSNGFYMDPSHLNPIPPDLLAFALENCGFRKIEILRLHPSDRPANLNVHEQIANYFYGPLDYAVIAYK